MKKHGFSSNRSRPVPTGTGIPADHAGAEQVQRLLQQSLTAYQREDYDVAWRDCQQALQLDPNRADGWTLAGMLHRKAKRLPEAAQAYRRAIQLYPGFPDAYNNLANLLFREMEQPTQALDYYRKALQIRPDFLDAHYNMGGVLQELGRVDEAIASFDRALALRPDYADAHWDLSLALLLDGQYERGFSEYEWRWRRGEPVPRPFVEPPWDGTPLHGRTLLVHAEQGLGDAIQFARYLPMLKALGARIVLEVRNPLLELFRTLPAVDQLVRQGDPLPPFDCHVPLLSLAHFLGTTLGSIPAQVPYLGCDPERIRTWAERIDQLRARQLSPDVQDSEALRIGFVWAGSPRVKNDHVRSPRLAPLLPLLTTPRTEFYILQQGDGRRDLETVVRRGVIARLPDNLIDIGAEVQDLADTAAIMTQMDLIISTDTATAHLAGALGRPTWIPLHFAADWRWLRTRTDSPWYPTVRLYRQSASQATQRRNAEGQIDRGRAWKPVVQTMKKDLEQHVRTTSPAARTPAQVEIPVAVAAPALPPATSAAPSSLTTSPEAAALAYPLLQNSLAAYGRSELDLATSLCQQALQHAPNMPEAWTVQGMIQRRAGNLPEAIRSYKQAIGINPRYIDAYGNLANAYMAMRNPEQAEQTYRLGLSLRPDWPEALVQMSAILRESNRNDESFAFARRALQLRPDYADGYFHLGNILKQMNRSEEACASYQRAIALQPVYAEAYYNFGVTLHDMERYRDALDCFRKALEQSPVFAQALYNMGVTLQKLGRTDQALDAYRKAAAINPNHHGAHFNTAGLLNGLGKFEDALASYHRALEISPNQVHVAVEIFHIDQRLCNWHNFHDLRERLLLPALAVNEQDVAASPFSFLSMPIDISDAEHGQLATIHARPIEQRIQPFGHDYSDRRTPHRLRIGYVSSDFRNHPISHLMRGLFERHDRSRFEIFGYSFGPDEPSSYRQHIREHCDHFVDIHEMGLRQAAERMYADQIDILIDLNGYTRDVRLEIFAYRPAPIQMTYLGYPGPLGASFIDYVLTDRIVTPPEQQPFYRERFAYLPHCYQVNDSAQVIAPSTPPRAAHGLPEGQFVFCCFNAHNKIEPGIFRVWMDILRAAPDSVLWLLDGHPRAKENLLHAAQHHGIVPERIIFAPRTAKDAHLARHQFIDLFLDTYYYNAHTTGSDALWAGVPILTCPGRAFASRVCASQLTAIGLADAGLIVDTMDQYRSRAIELARNPHLLHGIKQRLIQNRKTHPLFNTDMFVRDLEQVLLDIWQQWVTTSC